ncbi:MAG TPA: hypothetical protein VF820_04530 [Patescibacteria group bacterium]
MKQVNTFYPSRPHSGQQIVLQELDKGTRFIQLRAGRKWRKTSLLISWLFEMAAKTGGTCPYVAPNRVQAKNIAWNDHVQRMLDGFVVSGLKYKKNESELSVTLQNGGKVMLMGIENKEALRGISNWTAFCLTGDSVIDTDKGKIRIDKVRIGMKAKTPSGYQRILTASKTREVDHLIKIYLSNGETLTLTPNHHIFSEMGLVRADELRYNIQIWTTQFHKLLSSKKLGFGYKSCMEILDIIAQELAGKLLIYIMPSGKINMEKFRKDILSITKMETGSIIPSQTLSVFLGENTLAIIQNIAIEKTRCELENLLKEINQNYWNGREVIKTKNMLEKFFLLHKKQQKGGIIQKLVEHGMQLEEKKTGRIGNILKKFVKNVAFHIWQHIPKDHDTAPHVVGIRNLYFKEKLPVYNLTVEKDHCYFANNILVSNCGDEYDDWAEDIWPTIIRPNLIPHNAQAILAGTPKGFRNLYRLEQNPTFKSFHFSSYDNPDLDKKELTDLENEYKKMGMGYYRQEILAEYEKPHGVVYEEWDMTQYIPFFYDENLPLHLSWDFGVNDPTAILFLQPNGSELRLIDYYEASNASLDHFVDIIESKGYKHPELETGDIAGRARTLLTGKSPISLLRELGHHVRSMPIPDIEQQVRNAHVYIPNLWINSAKCERFRDCILNYRYPEKSTTLVDQDNEKPIHDEYSHAMRAFEYYCWNRTFGDVGGVKTGGRPIQRGMWGVQKDDGKQISINIDRFEK